MDKQMRIGIIIDDFYPASGGIGRSVQSQIYELNKAGHQVVLFAPKQFLEIPNNCETVVVPSIHIKGTPPHLCSLKFGKKLAKQISEAHQIDVIHSQTERGALLLATQVAKYQNIPHVHTFHANLAGTHKVAPIASIFGSLAYSAIITPLVAKYSRHQTRLIKPREAENNNDQIYFEKLDWQSMAKIASHVDTYTTPARFMIDNISRYLDPDTHPGEIIPSGVNPAFSQALLGSRRTRDDKEIHFVSMSRLSKEKRIDIMIDAFLKANIPNSQLHIAGTGDQLKTLSAQAAPHQNIIIHGHLDSLESIANLYINSDVFVLTSNGFDTQAVSIAEAASAGLPIIYCDKNLTVGVTKGNSILANSPSSDDIAKAMSDIADADLREKLAVGSAQIAKSLSSEQMGLSYIEAYQKLIKLG